MTDAPLRLEPPNGTLANANSSTTPYVVPPGPLRRINRIHAQAEMGVLIHQQTEQALRNALTAACEDVGLVVPQGYGIDLDWNTGLIRAVPPQEQTQP